MSDETIVFNGHRIDIISNEVESECDTDMEDYRDTDTVSYSTDIYSNDHPWDTRQPQSYRFRPDIWWCQLTRFFSHE